MQDPQPLPEPERAESTGAWPGSGSSRGERKEPGVESPTVLSGSSARRARALAGEGALPLPKAGDRIDSFELEESIGAGGMGAVFRALDGRLDRHVALKILPPEQAHDPEVVQRFYQEGRAAARLDNENIARVYTIGHDGDYHYIAFEYIEGTTIRHRVERNGPLPVSEAINYTLQIAGALVHAAERGVVHRDIKPSNIIVTPQGRAKLVDMGLARRFERGSDDGLTQSGMTLGTFDYISPEQARDPRDVDVRSDLYSLGCTLFHMVTGRPPFPDGTVLQKLLQHQEDAPPDVRSLNPEVPPDLANILVKLMAKDRDRRYQTPEQLVRDLLTVAGALGLRSVSPEGLVWMSASHPLGWERHLVWGIPTLALGLVVSALVWWGQELGAWPGRRRPDRQVQRGGPAEAFAPTEAPRIVEAPANPVPPEPSPADPAEGPIAVSRDIAVDSSEDLLSVLAAAPARSVVVLTDNGPYWLGGGLDERTVGRLQARDLVVKADAGVRPELRLSRDEGAAGETPAALLDFAGGRVTLEGLVLVVEAGERDEPLAAVRTEDTELTVRRCLFRRRGERVRRGQLAALHLRSTPASDRPAAVTIDACHIDGGQTGILATGPGDITLRDCTVAGAEPTFWADNPKAASPWPVDLQLRHVSVLPGEGPVLRLEGAAARVRVDDCVIGPARDGESVLVACDHSNNLDWHGRGNLYGRIGTFLQPIGARAGGEPVREWTSWEDELPGVLESGSTLARGRVWEESDPAQTLAQDGQSPTRAFRLDPAHPGPLEVGVRQGPFGPLAPSVRVAATTTDPRREVASTSSASPAPSSAADGGETGTSPMPPMPMPAEPAVSKVKVGSSGMPEMPVIPPMDQEDPMPSTRPAASSAPPAPAAEVRSIEESGPVPAVANPGANEAGESAVIRTAEQLLNVLGRDPAGGTLRIAADAECELPSWSIRAGVRWVLRAEPGPTRPRIRFRPAPARLRSPVAWSAWVELRAGTLQLEGIDVLLAQADAPPQGRWAALAVWGGAELSLTNCTVTIEGDQAIAAAVTVPAGENEVEEGVVGPEPSAAVVRVTDCLLRSGGDLVEVAAGHRLELELNNALVSTEGSLIHAHGMPRGQSPSDPIRLVMNRVTARTAGGLVQLESARGEPDLPVADVRVRDSILATTAQGAPLFRVDGQELLSSLRDRIRWEGHGVAYHQINAYRRDQSAQVGSVPNIYDRPSWMVAVGTKEDDPFHGDVKFLQPWDPSRPAWTLRRDDARLPPESPAVRAGADLERIPSGGLSSG